MRTNYRRFVDPASGYATWGIIPRADADRLEVLSDAPWREGAAPTGAMCPIAGLTFLAPAEPTKIVALAYNYRDLFADAGAVSGGSVATYTDPGFEPLVFLKGPHSLAHPGARIALPAQGEETWVEVEVAAVIGRRAKALPSRDAAADAIFGLTIGNDVTSLNVLDRDWHLARSKARDAYCPLGPALVRGLDDGDLAMRTAISGRVTQDSSSRHRILDTLESVRFVSSLMTLEPGDVVLTGTPAGARQSVVRAGDRVEMSVEGLGTLECSFTLALN